VREKVCEKKNPSCKEMREREREKRREERERERAEFN